MSVVHDTPMINPELIEDVKRYLSEVGAPSAYDPAICAEVVCKHLSERTRRANNAATNHEVVKYFDLRMFLGKLIDTSPDEALKIKKDAEELGVTYGFHLAGAIIAFLHNRGFLAPGIPGGPPDEVDEDEDND